MYYHDEYSKSFKDELEFHEFLEEVEERAQWIRVPSKELMVLPASGNEGICTPIKGIETAIVIADTMKHTGLLLNLRDKMYQLGSTAISSLLDRARISGSALSDLEKITLADLLNKCLKVAKGKALIRIFEGKVRAVLSGDNGRQDYSILPMPDVFMVASAYINGGFQHVKFQQGYVDHYLSTAIWDIEDEELVKTYREILSRYGKNVEEDLKAAIRVTTSDVGASGANIFYSLKEYGHIVVLGKALKLDHRKKATIEDFTDNIQSVFECYKEALEGVSKLNDINIRYPVNTMTGVMSKAGIGKKLTSEIVESFKAASGDQPCTAYEIYCGICEVLFLAQTKGMNGRMLAEMEEDVAKCIHIKWHDFDIPGDFIL